MSQNQEIIESKLCAYIDGELDPEGRAEIEKHLEANPQHRRLLESLRATRDLIRWLPREPAPPEIAETLNGQLERSVLLNYEGDSLGPSIWPRVFAAAAIVILTAGLGFAVYYALPRAQNPAQLALHAPAMPGSGNGDVVPSPPSNTEEARPDLTRMSDADRGGLEHTDRESIAAKPGPSDFAAREVAKTAGPGPGENRVDNGTIAGRMAGLNESSKSAELDELARRVAQNPAAFILPVDNTANTLPQNGNLSQTQAGNAFGANAMVLLVRSDAPDQTEKQLTTYFNEKQIQWRQAPLTFQAEANLQQPAPGAPPAQNHVLRRSQESLLKQSIVENAAGAEQRQEAQTFAMKASPRPDPSSPAPGINASTLAAGPATQPAPALVDQGQKQELRDMPTQRTAAAPLQIQQDAMQAALANSIRSDGVYVCQMSRRQAEQLSNTIANGASPAAQVKDLREGGYANAPAGEPASATANNSASSSSNQLAIAPKSSGGFGGGGADAGANDTLRQRAMKGGYEGGAGGQRSLKQTAEAKDKDDAARYSSPSPAPAAAAATPAQSDGPAGAARPPVAGKLESETAQNQSAPTERGAPAGAMVPAGLGSAPATQPAVAANLSPAATVPADEPVNVVIMVQANTGAPAPAGGAAPPATQPASDVPQQSQPSAPPNGAPQQAR